MRMSGALLLCSFNPQFFIRPPIGWLRWCFASKDLARLAQGVDRLRSWISAGV
jgi:hypothetical protein